MMKWGRFTEYCGRYVLKSRLYYTVNVGEGGEPRYPYKLGHLLIIMLFDTLAASRKLSTLCLFQNSDQNKAYIFLLSFVFLTLNLVSLRVRSLCNGGYWGEVSWY